MENNKDVKRINIEELVKVYNQRQSTKMKEEFLKAKVKVVPYVGYATKMYLAQQIIDRCCMNDKTVYFDSCKQYILYIYSLLKYWTNIDIKEIDLLNQYDLLDMNDMLESIINLIPEKECVTFKTILDMKREDFISNKCNINNAVNDIFNSVYLKLSESTTPFLHKLNDILEDVNYKKFKEEIKKFGLYLSENK